MFLSDETFKYKDDHLSSPKISHSLWEERLSFERQER